MKNIAKKLIFLSILNLLFQGCFGYVLSSNEINNYLKVTIQKELSTQLNNISSDFTFSIQGIPNEKITTNETTPPKIKITSQNTNFLPNQYKLITIQNSKNQTIKTFPINVQTHVYKEVLIATNTISFNQEVNSNNTKLQRMEITRNLKNNITTIAPNKIAKRNFAKNAIITPEGLKEKTVITKNSLVNIKFQSKKGLEIKVQGYALKDGAIGDTILVKSDKYNKTYSAIVNSANEVVVRI